MSWIAVHDEVIGSKLRGFRKKAMCSEAEALGILTYLWLWARKNADSTGFLDNTEDDDIENIIKPVITNNLDSKVVTAALFECKWFDKIDGNLYVHDWHEWQSYWYSYINKKEKDRARKKVSRDKEDSKIAKNSDKKVSEKEGKTKENKNPPKTKYAEKVSMYPEQRAKLVDRYGEPFTLKLIETLDNYKGACGKEYKDDYRAILNWVVEKCEQKYGNLKKNNVQQISVVQNPDENPFAEFMEN